MIKTWIKLKLAKRKAKKNQNELDELAAQLEDNQAELDSLAVEIGEIKGKLGAVEKR